MNLTKKLFILFLIFIFAFSPISPSSFFVFSQEEDEQNKEITGYQEWEGNKLISEDTYVTPEATLVVKKGTTVTFQEGKNIIVDGKLFVKGTKQDPVKFRKEGTEEAVENADGDYSGYSINITGEAYFRNADITGGGNSVSVFVDNRSFFNQTYAGGYATGVIIADGSAKLRIEESDIHGNISGINLEYLNNESYVKVNRTSFFHNIHRDVSVAEFSRNNKIPDFKYNWWGSSGGPEIICYTPTVCRYEKIKGNVNVSNWLISENFTDPVIIIPGIMGSEKFLEMGETKLDPYFHIYDSLYETLDENGYTPEQDLFTFPYEWRDSNSTNAPLLRDKINAIKQARNWPKVDIIAHSMGGLLAREYIESDYYQDDVDQLITLGTPHEGAPKDYLAWEGGEIAYSYSDIIGVFMEKFFSLEAHGEGYSSIFDYIRHRPIESVRELLPIYDYLKDEGDEKLRDYPSNYPVNPFLENLNLSEKSEKLLYVSFEDIVGNVDNDKTINTIRVGKPSIQEGSLWEHGYPENYNSLFGDHGMEMGAGDKTVPLSSSLGVRADNVIVTNHSHNDLPGKTAGDVYELLTGGEPDHEVDYIKISKLLAFFVFSPIDIQVITPPDENGVQKRVGKNFETGETINQIDGAYYTGSDTDAEFLTIPNPIDGEYRILTQATGDGDYKIEVSSISEDEDNPEEADESTAEITGTAQTGQTDELKVNLENNEVTTESKDEILPTITITSPEAKEYLNNQILPLNYSVSDNVSPVDKIISEVYYDNEKTDAKEIDLSLEHLGNHQIKITAEDEAGNNSEKIINFQISTSVAAIIQNVNHYYDLKLITNKKEKEFLENQLRILEKNLALLEKIKENDKIKPRVKKELTELFEKLANKHIDLIIKFIERDRHNAFTEKARELLIESLNFIRLK